MQNKRIDFLKQALIDYCLYRERCTNECLQKLTELQADANESEAVLEFLRDERFLDDERFAYEYARGKFRLLNWGPRKIQHHLRGLGISDQLIETAISKALPQDEIDITLNKLIDKRTKNCNPQNDKTVYHKLINYLLQKGYYYDEVIKHLKQ